MAERKQQSVVHADGKDRDQQAPRRDHTHFEQSPVGHMLGAVPIDVDLGGCRTDDLRYLGWKVHRKIDKGVEA